jgi:hypothetical protein
MFALNRFAYMCLGQELPTAVPQTCTESETPRQNCFKQVQGSAKQCFKQAQILQHKHAIHMWYCLDGELRNLCSIFKHMSCYAECWAIVTQHGAKLGPSFAQGQHSSRFVPSFAHQSHSTTVLFLSHYNELLSQCLLEFMIILKVFVFY